MVGGGVVNVVTRASSVTVSPDQGSGVTGQTLPVAATSQASCVGGVTEQEIAFSCQTRQAVNSGLGSGGTGTAVGDGHTTASNLVAVNGYLCTSRRR